MYGENLKKFLPYAKHHFWMKIECNSVPRVVPIWLEISYHQNSYIDRLRHNVQVQSQLPSPYFPNQLSNSVLPSHDECSYVVPGMTFPYTPTKTRRISKYIRLYTICDLPVCTCLRGVPYYRSETAHVVANNSRVSRASCIPWQCKLVGVSSRHHTIAPNLGVGVDYGKNNGLWTG